MNLIDRLHMLHRFWRYRMITEAGSVKFLLRQELLGTTLLDVWANRGIYSYWMSRKAGPTGKVIAFEPQPELGPFLEDLRDTFGLHNLEIVNKAVSDSCGSGRLFRSRVGDGGARLSSRDDDDAAGTLSVGVTTLDEYLAGMRLPRISFIKIDVEGRELGVMTGAERVIRDNRPIILFECHHPDAEKGGAFAFLRGLGYGGFFFHGGRRRDYTLFDKVPYRVPGLAHRNYVVVHGG